jgi:hypothetical protein
LPDATADAGVSYSGTDTCPDTETDGSTNAQADG